MESHRQRGEAPLVSGHTHAVAELRWRGAGPAPPASAQFVPVYLNSRIAPGLLSADVAPPVGPLVLPWLSVIT
ncbi:uncharacterized protein SOCE836_070740 [Sorangium cellulosum]|uniref:Uncharacterized protein n=1 Tax=Sorangium cellulosum TaxID=56 RepID=A0A4P2QWV4_SORCE|nr:uncharacterized protein SOCE836_070740 [Sorangium cellulosum]WCQ94201.1 hypothetical protein NQZ70_06958 [Sorangium sp. Soce836]